VHDDDDDDDDVDYQICHTSAAHVCQCEIVTKQSRVKPEVGPPHNDVIRQLNGILTAHLNLAAIRAPAATSP